MVPLLGTLHKHILRHKDFVVKGCHYCICIHFLGEAQDSLKDVNTKWRDLSPASRAKYADLAAMQPKPVPTDSSLDETEKEKRKGRHIRACLKEVSCISSLLWPS